MFQKLSKPKVLKQWDNHLNATHCNPKLAKTMNNGGMLLEQITNYINFLIFGVHCMHLHHYIFVVWILNSELSCCGIQFSTMFLPPKLVYVVIMSFHPWTCKWVMKGVA
jgi:hypothetical protein